VSLIANPGWALGRPFGVAPVTTAAVALVLDLPVMATTQPGFAINDTFGLATMLAALALLANGYATEPPGIQPGALALAGAAMGLAVGTKVSFLAAAAAISVVIAVWHRRPRLGSIAALWGIPLLVTGGYWYLRNLVRAQNPFPWVSHVGPLHLPSPDQGLNGGPPNNVAHYLFDGSVWSDFYLPGFRAELGPLWFLLLGGALAAMVLALLRRQPPSVRMAGAAGLALFAFYIVTPTAAEGPEGHPYLFQFNLRYTVPALTIGLALIPILLRNRAPQLRWGLLAGYAALTVFATRRGADFWHSGGALLGAIAISVLVLLVVAIATGGRRWRRAVTVGVAAAVCLVAVALAWPQTTHYLDHRYRSGSPGWLHRFAIDPMFSWAQGLHDQRIGVSGILQYGLYGEDLSNHVQFLGKVGSDHSFREIRDCRTWRRVVDAGDYDYVITMPRYGGNRAPQARWTEQPGVTTRVLRSEPVTVFRLDGELDPAGCAAGAGAGPPTRRQ